MAEQKIAKTMTDVLNPKDELELSLLPFNEMGSQLGMAPLAIGVLGHLCLISTKGDFDLRCNASFDFKLLQFPDSFRACLCQVASAGASAFLKADSAMEAIRLHTGRVPNLMRTTLGLLYDPKSTSEDLNAFLPININQIKVVADECIIESSKVEQDFQHIINLLTELQTATLCKQGKVQEAKNFTENRIKREKIQQERLKTQEKSAKEELEKFKKECADYTKKFNQSLDSMPGLGKMITASLFDGVRNILSSLTFSTTRNLMNLSPSQKEHQNNLQGSQYTTANNSDQLSSLLDHNAQVSGDELRKYLFEASTVETVLNAIENSLGINNTTLPTNSFSTQRTASHENTPNENFDAVKYELDYLITQLENKSGAEVFRKTLLNKLRDLEKYLKELKENKNDSRSRENLKNAILNLSKQLRNIIICMKSICNVPQFPREGPQIGNTKSSSSITANLTAQALKKVEMTRLALETVKKQSDEANRRHNQLLDDINNSIQHLEKFEFDENQQTNVLEVITEGLKAFAKLKDQWTNLIQFFKSIANFVKCSMAPELNVFTKNATAASEKNLRTIKSKETIYQSAFQSVKVAYIVNHLSETYCHVSKNHLIPLNNHLFHLLALDRMKDAQTIKSNEMSLRQNAINVNEEIRRFVNAKHSQYLAASNLRLQNMFMELENLAPISQEVKKEIRDEAKFLHDGVVESPGLTNEQLDAYC